MAKINISLNGTEYSIDESILAPTKNNLKTHLSTVINGSGSVLEPITYDGVITNHIYTSSGGGEDLFVKVGESALSADDLLGATFTMNDGTTIVVTENNMTSTDYGVIIPGAAISVADVTEMSYVFDATFTETGLYFIDHYPIYPVSLTFPGALIITLDGVDYSVDSTKISDATANLVAHLGTIAGEGVKVTVGGVEYGVDSTKVAGAISGLKTAFGNLSGGTIPEEERLEGDGAEYYTLAPTALSFRSTAPLNEFQEVKVNGQTIDPANYTLEEGSTIVKLSTDYLKTLEKGNYEVDIVSESKSVKGNFTVAAPELNEHGFYYNQPYSANLPMFGGDTAFFVREDGTFDIITVGKDLTTSTYTVDGNNIVAIVPPLGTVNCTISTDGTSIYCNEVATTFELNGSIAITADDDYVYEYKEGLGGYVVRCIDKAKSEYGVIRTCINGVDTVKLADEMFYRVDGVASALTNIVIPDSVVIVGDRTFKNCKNLENVTLPNSVTSIGVEAFYHCNDLRNIIIPDSVTNIAEEAFCSANLRELREVPGTVSVINEGTFQDSLIVDIALGEGITSIGTSAFSNCRFLNSIKIPSSVVSIGNNALVFCGLLMNITYAGTISQWEAIEKGTDWDKGTAHKFTAGIGADHETYRNYTVHCTDGTIVMENGIPTYVQCSDGDVAL